MIKDHIQILGEIVELANFCDSRKGLEKIITLLQSVIPFEVYGAFIVTFDKAGNISDNFNVCNFSKLWQLEYLTKGYKKIDPITLRNFSKDHLGEFQIWEDTYREIETTSPPALLQKQRKFIAASKKYDQLSNGMTIGYKVNPDFCGLAFSIAGKDLKYSKELQSLMSVAAPYIHLAMLSLRAKGRKKLLTPQQIKVLTLLKDGHNKPQIAEIMKIKESTVKYHLEESFARLGATTQAQAVAEALSKGLIHAH